jgi:hypothetical protein
LLTKEGWAKSAVVEFREHRQALSRFFVGATVLTEPVLAVIRRELKRVSPDVKIDTEQIRSVLLQEVFKREVVEGEKFGQATRTLTRAATRALRNRSIEEVTEGLSMMAAEAPAAVPSLPMASTLLEKSESGQ